MARVAPAFQPFSLPAQLAVKSDPEGPINDQPMEEDIPNEENDVDYDETL